MLLTHCNTPTETEVLAWFSQHGQTDTEYLKQHSLRFEQTLSFSDLSPNSKVLDIGAHWLHQAFYFVNAGHSVVAMDASQIMLLESVQSAAKAMQVSLIHAENLQAAEGFDRIDSDSIDTILLCEVLEHLAFNPLRMWRAIYRILRPGGRIILTTPNFYYGPNLRRRLKELMLGRTMATTTAKELLTFGTRGHHWKEYSAKEIETYFSLLSPDIRVERLEHKMTSRYPFDFVPQGIEEEISKAASLYGDKIFVDIRLTEKSKGITAKALWGD